MYNEQLEQLINAALTDGVLTEKEKQVLFKKAHELGVDLDEFEMVLDAKLFEAQEAEKARRAKAAPKSDKYADVKKCPVCGSIIPPNTKVCPGCGMLFSNDQKDIKEIAMLQDNYVKICNVNIKFPTVYIYISVFILITLFNVFCWVYAIACKDLVGLPVLSTIVWLIAIPAFIVLISDGHENYKESCEEYNEAVAEHKKLYSTADAFYAQDKNTLNRINDVASQVDKVVAEKNKTKNVNYAISLGILGLTIILSFALSFGWFRNVLIRNCYGSCYSAIEKAIENNDMDKAENYYEDYKGYYAYVFVDVILRAYVERDDETKVLSYFSLHPSSKNVRTFVNYYISKEQHQSAIDIVSRYDDDDYTYKALEICIRDFMKKGKKTDALKLIKTNSHLFNGTERKAEIVKELTKLTQE